mgnify:CR=1 FL=1
MEFTAQQIAQFVQGKVEGDETSPFPPFSPLSLPLFFSFPREDLGGRRIIKKKKIEHKREEN